MTVDPEIYRLAESVLEDHAPEGTKAALLQQHEAHISELADDLQTTCDSFIAEKVREAVEQDAHDAELRSLRGYSDEEKARI